MQRSKKILLISLGSLFATIILMFIGFNGILKFIVRDQTSLRNRNMIRQLYLKLPISLDFKVYLFNISNPSEVEQGKNPIVKEIGPYWYDTYKEKIDVVDNEGEDTLTYTPYEQFFFNQEKSKNLSEDDYVTILNPLVVGPINYVLKNMEPFVSIVVKSWKIIFNNPKSIYFTVKVRELLFDGILINCTYKDYVSKAVCPQLKVILANLLLEPQKNIFLLSFLGRRNGTLPQRIKVLRGVKNSKKLGRVIEFNEQKHLSIWGSETCNRFKGTDSWIFPPFLTKEEGIWTFTADLCRSIEAKFYKDVTYRGISARKYNVSLGDQSKNQEDKCFCPSPTTCLPKGVFDLSKCIGIPIFSTLPHMLDVDPIIRKKIKGMKPNGEKHAILLIYEYILGVPLKAAKRMQFNLPLKSVNKVSFMKDIPNVLHPIIWIEESVELSGFLFNVVYSVMLLLKILSIVRFCFLGLSLAGLGYGIFLHCKHKKDSKITPLQSSRSSSRSDPKSGRVDEGALAKLEKINN